ncbi:PAS domain S-box-containing protein [Prosthecobacter fusiformis]|uniref:PAS domain S-box-containing protein n=1 Tax=Prosthecobacter fusiformis TaxID=48464 RepID=A0A4R7S1V0_9BACT|nr:PAS domain-containing protein [Prosthecobacter fusiformis]TDU71195.1 PAS domain S-box-containing protein [Prosthecobacter fusiformis]
MEDAGEGIRPAEDMEVVLGVLIENAPVAMAMFDDQMHYMLANRSWIEEFSLQGVHPLIGRSQYDVFPVMHPGWRQVYDRALQGHVVRSEHDALSGPDGRRVVYRWEVRPWRRKKDASVGGLMVTCEKFGNAAALQALVPEGEPPVESKEEKAPHLQLVNTNLPMVMLDEMGIVQQTNTAAAEMGLSRGIQEGASAFWEVFADPREASRLQLSWGGVLEKLAGEARSTGWVMEMPAMQRQIFTDAEKAPPQRWLITHCEGGEAKRYLAMLLPAMAAPPAPPRVNFTAPPNLPAIANAVASISQPQAESSSQALEMRRLQDELARARQELRTLHEAERVFTQRDSRVRQYLDALPCGVLVLDDLGTPLYQNEPLTKLLGRPLRREETVENWLSAACPNDEHRTEVTLLWRDDVWRRQLTRIFSLATADGLLKELEFQPSGLPGGGLLVCIQDATEHCRHEEQLRATEAKFRTLLHECPVPVVLMDKAGSVFEVNHLAEILLGHPKTELRRYPLDAWLDPQDARARRETVRQMQESGERSTSLEVKVLQPGRESVPALLTLAQVLDSSGEPHCTVHFFQKKEAVKAVPSGIASAPGPVSAGLSSKRMGTSTERLLRTNVNGRIKEISPRGMELLGLTESDAKGRALHLHFRPSDPTGFYTELTRLAQSSDPVSTLDCFTRDGTRQSCHLRVVASGGGGFDFDLYDASIAGIPTENSFGPAFTGMDPNSQPLFQTLLTSAWPVADLSREKLLLSETHHRIKNHLQIISSLLNLESNTITDSTARTALRSSQNRVRAIAELHQHLYQIALGTAENFSVFASGLVQRLRDCYDISPERVAVRLDLEEGNIQQEWLMPLALTLNETLSNSFEHGFPGDRSGAVKVNLTFGSQGGRLVVSDDGAGFPPDFSAAASPGLGLKILAVFAEQMRGQLNVGASNSGGTEIQLRFPIAYADI